MPTRERRIRETVQKIARDYAQAASVPDTELIMYPEPSWLEQNQQVVSITGLRLEADLEHVKLGWEKGVRAYLSSK